MLALIDGLEFAMARVTSGDHPYTYTFAAVMICPHRAAIWATARFVASAIMAITGVHRWPLAIAGRGHPSSELGSSDATDACENVALLAWCAYGCGPPTTFRNILLSMVTNDALRRRAL
ncbi:hypothetical protein PPROV_000545400 [Pycnococcus provasolii]|uniref:Uncharacterized protein n=1 Tax=Pycnococcus provasolii TaxID=41880 RepID=A0A830HNP4_9CHLO|nr:hypothetical protein PPROV_000545400 [Pycnococcus provasolii]